MENLKRILISIFIVFTFNFSIAQKVVGYMDVNLAEASTRTDLMNWGDMTDFIYGFITPDANGELPDPFSLTLFETIRQKCIDHGVDLHFSSGGATNSSMFEALGKNPTAVANYADEIADMLESTGMKGWDLDWEFPKTASAQISQVNILKAVHDEFLSRGKRDEWKIAIAVGGETPSVGSQGVYHTDYCSSDAFQYIDYLNVMSYDIGRNISGDNNHSSYADGVNNVNDWVTKGCPIEKIILGVPFYARHKTSRALPSGGFYNITYGKISESDPAKYFNQNNSGDFYYNGAPLLKQKVDYIMGAGGAGVLIWEVTYDRFDEYSLLKALSDAMSPYGCDAPQPDLGLDQSICGVTNLQLDGGVETAPERTFTWKKGIQTLVDKSSTANTFNVTSTGGYTLEVWENGCNSSDDIEITGTLESPDLGGPYELCDPVSVTLDAGISPVGRTITWLRDNIEIAGETGKFIEVKKGGVYKVSVMAVGCSAVSASTTVTSEVPYANNDTVCNSGMESILIANETVKWYSSEFSSTPLVTDQEFIEIIDNTTTYWMGGAGSALTEYTTLKPFSSGGWAVSATNYATKIEVLSELSILKISLNPSSAGTLKLNLLNESETILETKSFSVSGGTQEISLDWMGIAPGTYYINAVGSSVSLIMDGTQASSDFLIEGVISSDKFCYEKWSGPYTASTNYGLFTNMKISAGKECMKVPVTIVVDPTNTKACLTVSYEAVNKESFRVYPNPSTNEFNFFSLESGVLEVVDLKGVLVSKINFNNGNVEFGHKLRAGVYILKVETESTVVSKRIVKK
jgi:GH18 family chitinase